MNGLGEVQENIIKFVCEKQCIQEEIVQIEKQREELAKKRNELKKISPNNNCEINELGNQIANLGNQSQELQNKLDSSCCATKSQINLMIDNLVAEGIRKIRKINEEVNELQDKIEKYEERNEKYQLQKEEFYLRFGRMPELSEKAIKENQMQKEETEQNTLMIQNINKQIEEIEGDITLLARTKREIKNGNWKFILENENKVEEIFIEPLNIEEIENLEEIYIEEFEPLEEMYVEEFQPIEEINIEKFETTEEVKEERIAEIEELAKAIIEEIIANQQIQQTENIQLNNEKEEIIEFEKQEVEKEEKKDKVIIPLFGQKATIQNIIIKFEEKELVYNAQMSDGEEIKIHPSQLGEENVLLRDKQNREECKEILINYVVNEYKELDKKVINKIDPLICELLIECAEEYGYDAQELIYNYAMSFSNSNVGEVDFDKVPGIIYNLSHMEESRLTRKEKAIINKICKNARKNSKVEIIESFSGFKKIKYIFKKLFTVNNVKVLPEAKY